MSVIHPVTGREISTDSRRFRGKKPVVIHTSSVKNMGLNSKKKPIDPKIVAKRVRIKKRA